MPVEAAPGKSALAAPISLGMREQCADLLRDALDLPAARLPHRVQESYPAANTVSIAARSGAAAPKSAAIAANTRRFSSPKSRARACADQLREHGIAPLRAHEIQQMRQLLLQQFRRFARARRAAGAPRVRGCPSRSAICARSSAARGNGAISLRAWRKRSRARVRYRRARSRRREFAQIVGGDEPRRRRLDAGQLPVRARAPAAIRAGARRRRAAHRARWRAAAAPR